MYNAYIGNLGGTLRVLRIIYIDVYKYVDLLHIQTSIFCIHCIIYIYIM